MGGLCKRSLAPPLKLWRHAVGGPQQVFEYLARYTHKICISNYRILKVDTQNVTFRYLDRKMDQSKIKTAQGTEFIKRFAEHITSSSE